jgi:hypothetical protein
MNCLLSKRLRFCLLLSSINQLAQFWVPNPRRFFMTQSTFPNHGSTPATNWQGSSQLKPLDAEVIRALTPLFIAAIGGIIGITVLVTGASDAGFGLASTAIAGAAGLAQPHKDQNPRDGSKSE